MYGSTSLRLMLSLLSESQQVPFLLPDALWMLNCQYPRWFIYFGICFSFRVELLRSVSAEIISRPLEDFLLSPLLTSALFSCSWGCAPSIKQTAQTSYCDFQNRTETAIDSMQLTTVLVITPPSWSSQLVILLLISLRMKNQGRLSLFSQHPNHQPASVPESSAPILLQ